MLLKYFDLVVLGACIGFVQFLSLFVSVLFAFLMFGVVVDLSMQRISFVGRMRFEN